MKTFTVAEIAERRLPAPSAWRSVLGRIGERPPIS